MEPPSSRREGAYPNRNDLLTEDFTSGVFPERAKTLEERGKRFPHGEEGSPSKKVHTKVVQLEDTFSIRLSSNRPYLPHRCSVQNAIKVLLTKGAPKKNPTLAGRKAHAQTRSVRSVEQVVDEVVGSRIGFCARRSPRESRQLWRLLERRPTRGGHEPINTQQKTQEALYERHGASEVHVLQEGCLGSGASLAEQGEESGGGGVKDVRKSRARLERPANLLLQVSSATTSFASRSLFLATTVSRLADLVLPFAFLL